MELPERLVEPSHQNQLKNLLQRYVDSIRSPAPDTSTVRECLQAVSQQERYELIASVKRRGGYTAIHWTAWRDHTELVNCLLDFVTQKQCYELLKIQTRGGVTAIHCAAHGDHPHIIQCILDRLTTDQQLHLLNIQCEGKYRTALEVAQAYNKESAVAVLQQYRSAAETVIQQKQLTDRPNADEDRRNVATRVDRLEETIVEQAEQIQSKETLINELVVQVDQLKRASEDGNKKISELEDEIQRIEKVEALQEEKSEEQEQKITAQGMEIVKLREAVAVKESQLTQAVEQLNSLVTRMNVLEARSVAESVVDQVGDNSKRLNDTETQLNTQAGELASCQEQVNTQQGDIYQLKVDVTKQQEKTTYLENKCIPRGGTEAMDNSDTEADYEEVDNPHIDPVIPTEEGDDPSVQDANPHSL